MNKNVRVECEMHGVCKYERQSEGKFCTFCGTLRFGNQDTCSKK